AASLRSDLQEAFLKIAAFQPLLTLDRGGRELKLAAPGPADMREVIEGPAARAGLSFETREEVGKSLADELAAAVGAAADALPLLQMTLALLFERRDPDHKLLRWADYTAMGGLEGAIASQAERVLSGLPEAVGAELGPLLRQLTRLWLSLDGEIELRPADLDESSLSGTRAELARALVAGRLVVADQGKLRIVHEAVLRSSPPPTPRPGATARASSARSYTPSSPPRSPSSGASAPAASASWPQSPPGSPGSRCSPSPAASLPGTSAASPPRRSARRKPITGSP